MTLETGKDYNVHRLQNIFEMTGHWGFEVVLNFRVEYFHKKVEFEVCEIKNKEGKCVRNIMFLYITIGCS